MMNRLSGLDGVSLHGETPEMPTHVLAVAFVDPSARGDLTAGALVRLLAERATAIPQFRQRLLTKPFGLGQPAWVEDPAIDIHDHLHRARLTEPGTMRELTAFIGEVHAQPLDRRRPLWEAWVVQGLSDGRLVVVIKFSHALADGVGAVTSLLPELMTADPHAEFVEPQRSTATMPGLTERVRDAIDEVAANSATGLRVTAKLAPVAVKSVIGSAAASVRQLITGTEPQRATASDAQPDESSPPSRLNAPLTTRRSVAFAGVPMDDLHAITAAFGVTINDVFLTATTSALRRWLDTYEAVPSAPLRTMMPISTRCVDDNSSNSWSTVAVTLPVHLDSAAAQLASIHETTASIKKARRSTPPVNLADVIDLVPPALIGLASGVYSSLKLSRFHPPVAHAITSNVPGPAKPVYAAGAHVLGIHAMAPLVGANLNVTAVSYASTFAVGLVACPDNVEDVASIARAIEDVVGELKIAAQEKSGYGAAACAGLAERAVALTNTPQFTPTDKRASAQTGIPGRKQPA
ncbi:MAG: wax ester/triacylglycerol synthase family O-acyltransferase [Actinomycetia bacterium]|nr:wax ester/triacylglycerol synthase family O-acyltransferase [Actinomycetes bacterium]